MALLKCILYIAGIGILANLIGAALPRSWFHPDRFPFRCQKWEQGGQIYEKIGIRVWKDKLPDMSKVVHNLYRKEVDPRPNAENLERLIQETCVAELSHYVLLLLSLAVTRIWHGVGGWVVWGLCILGHLPFSIIQRFNRPRLQRTLDRLRAREAARACNGKARTSVAE